jgi:isochorismate hydrolase
VKERYFSPQLLHSKSLDMLQKIDVYRRRPTARFDPDRSALLVLDMQAYFLEAASHAYIPSAEAIVPLIQELARAYVARGRPIIYTQHVNSVHDAGRMASWWRDLITDEHPLSPIISALDVSSGVVIRKSQYDAFYLTPLEDLLRRQAITQLVICGVMTHLCCETTARSAFMRGFDVLFPVDGTATYTEAHHLASLLNLSHGFATPALMQDILAAVRMSDET